MLLSFAIMGSNLRKMCAMSPSIEVFDGISGDAFNFSMYNTQILLRYQYSCNVSSNLMKSYYGRNFTTGRFWFGFLNLGAESNLCMWRTVIHVCCVARFSRSAPGAEHLIRGIAPTFFQFWHFKIARAFQKSNCVAWLRCELGKLCTQKSCPSSF